MASTGRREGGRESHGESSSREVQARAFSPVSRSLFSVNAFKTWPCSVLVFMYFFVSSVHSFLFLFFFFFSFQAFFTSFWDVDFDRDIELRYPFCAATPKCAGPPPLVPCCVACQGFYPLPDPANAVPCFCPSPGLSCLDGANRSRVDTEFRPIQLAFGAGPQVRTGGIAVVFSFIFIFFFQYSCFVMDDLIYFPSSTWWTV